MDFYLTCLPCSKCKIEPGKPSLHLIVVRAFDLLIASIIDHEAAAKSKETKNIGLAKNGGLGTTDESRLGIQEIDMFLRATAAVGEVVLAGVTFDVSAEKHVCRL
jgi:hypothetical protein